MRKNISGKYNIAVLSIYPMPYGGAATNRISAYSKALCENGASIDIFIPYPTDNIDQTRPQLPDKGVINDIHYTYTTGRYPNSSLFIRGIISLLKLKYIIGFVTSYSALKKAVRNKKYEILIINTDRISFLLWYRFVAKKINAKSIFIFDEYPIPIRHKLKPRIPKWKQIGYRITLKKIDAYISISEKLKEYYCNFSSKQTFVLPIIIDTDKFGISVQAEKEKNNKYLCYMGNMELAKDDVDNIIQAFSFIANDYPDIDLYLYGKPATEVEIHLTPIINALGLSNRVLFKGYARNDSVPQILANAYILVSSQPDTIRASGGFPTKLGEYLATGVPSVFTDVGENSKYVRDKEHVFFVKPEDPEAYAKQIKFILDNYDKALHVAKQGQLFVRENYSVKIQGEKMICFLKKISQKTSFNQ